MTKQSTLGEYITIYNASGIGSKKLSRCKAFKLGRHYFVDIFGMKIIRNVSVLNRNISFNYSCFYASNLVSWMPAGKITSVPLGKGLDVCTYEQQGSEILPYFSGEIFSY